MPPLMAERIRARAPDASRSVDGNRPVEGDANGKDRIHDRRARPQAVRLRQRPARQGLSSRGRRHQRAGAGARGAVRRGAAARTDEFRQQLADGKTLDDILVPAFATVREAAKRTLGQRHFDVQLIGGMVLHEGRIAEMKTGEGKTLVATLPVYLNALAGKGVHVVTVNDYLAKPRRRVDGPDLQLPRADRRRDRARASTTSSARPPTPATSPTAPTTSSASTILRDNMKYRLEDMVQRGHATPSSTRSTRS